MTGDRRLAGKRVLITGTGTPGGQGASAQQLFCAQGAAVAGCDVVAGAAESIAAVLAADGHAACGSTADLGDPAAARDWVDWAAEQLGGVDVLYNNAAIPVFAFLDDLTAEQWRSTMTNELDNVFYVTSAAWPHLKTGGGAIISTASVAAESGDGHLGLAAHAAAKAGVIALTRQLAAEGAPFGIRANSISPGFVNSPRVSHMPAELRAYMSETRTMLRRGAEPLEVAYLALYLASDESRFVTGSNFHIDGGWTGGVAGRFAARFEPQSAPCARSAPGAAPSSAGPPAPPPS